MLFFATEGDCFLAISWRPQTRRGSWITYLAGHSSIGRTKPCSPSPTDSCRLRRPSGSLVIPRGFAFSSTSRSRSTAKTGWLGRQIRSFFEAYLGHSRRRERVEEGERRFDHARRGRAAAPPRDLGCVTERPFAGERARRQSKRELCGRCIASCWLFF